MITFRLPETSKVGYITLILRRKTANRELQKNTGNSYAFKCKKTRGEKQLRKQSKKRRISNNKKSSTITSKLRLSKKAIKNSNPTTL